MRKQLKERFSDLENRFLFLSDTVESPILNKKGNSYRGMKFLEEFTTQTGESIF